MHLISLHEGEGRVIPKVNSCLGDKKYARTIVARGYLALNLI